MKTTHLFVVDAHTIEPQMSVEEFEDYLDDHSGWWRGRNWRRDHSEEFPCWISGNMRTANSDVNQYRLMLDYSLPDYQWVIEFNSFRDISGNEDPGRAWRSFERLVSKIQEEYSK